MNTVQQIAKFNAQSSGRDKLCRFFQYTTKLIKWYAETVHRSPTMILKLKRFEQSLGASRKVLKFGKSLDMILGAISNLSEKDPIIRTCLVLAKLNQACYLALDHYVWFTKIGVFDADAKMLVRISSRFWLVTLFFNLLRNLHDIVNIWALEVARANMQNEETKELMNGDPSMDAGKKLRVQPNLLRCLLNHPPVLVDTIKNVADLWLPLCNLRVINLSMGIQSLLGMASSYMGIIAAWDPDLKLIPS